MAEAHRVDVVVSAIDKASAPLKRIGGGFNMLSKQGLMAGAMFAGVTIGIQAAMQGFQKLQQWISESIMKFREFERAMSEVRTMLSELNEKYIPEMSKGILQMSIAFGKGAVDLARGLYQVLSAGVDASKSMMVLRESAKLATATLTSVETAVDAVTTVLNAYGMGADQAGYVTNIMAKTIQLGKLRMDELANSLGFIVPIAAQAGINFEEISAALATLTKQGINAQKATRGLRQVVNTLIAPSKESKDAMIDMGIAYDDLVVEAIGVSGVMGKINEATEGQIGAVTRLIPNVQALSAALALNAQSGNMLANSLEYIRDDFNALDEMIVDITSTFDFARKQAEAYGETIDISVGEKVKEGATVTEFWGRTFKLMGLSLKDAVEVMDDADEAMAAVAENPLMQPEVIDAVSGAFNKLNSYISDQIQLVVKLTGRQAVYNRELDALREAKDIATQTHAYTEALRYIPLALKDATYTTKIYNATIDGVIYNVQALVDSIRMQREELERLDSIQRQYNMETSRNTIAMMEIQFAASGRRGRLNRSQRNQMKELQRANDELRINTMRNQLEMAEAREELRPEEKQLERVKTSYAEQIHIITDTYRRDQEAMQLSIEYKELLIADYVGYIDIANDNIYEAQKLFYAEWLALDAQFQRALIDQNPWLKEAVIKVTPLFQRLADIGLPAHQLLKTLGLPIPGAQTGIPYVPETRPYLLHRGERVTPASENRGGMGGRVHVDPMTINVNIYDHNGVEQLVQKIELALQSGLVSGITTGYS